MPLVICIFIFAEEGITVVAETSITIFLASVNFLILFYQIINSSLLYNKCRVEDSMHSTVLNSSTGLLLLFCPQPSDVKGRGDGSLLPSLQI